MVKTDVPGLDSESISLKRFKLGLAEGLHESFLTY